ncbi:MerR family transcriptional regulator [Bacteroides sp. OttesenSCG-928-J23]|nr:MerR family transcriptional regulator [Bacteroides sp. OttesenSCG-928-N06]MDL2247156.1 MerR family transcriptional regulator [Bacteroides sp. OttesenSCG-928-J23]MDL2306226.1 MerR family transcriptional regulator [Bacteroides sp. OttesenSCG-928-D19]
MPLKTNKNLKLFYSIREVSRMFNVNDSLLRFWEKEFPEITPRKTPGGTRQYTQENIEMIKLVYHLVKEKGMTLSGARQRLAANKESATNNFEVIEKLKSIKEELLAIKKELDGVPNSSSV